MSLLSDDSSVPLEKVCELVCAHAELQAEHERLKKRVKTLHSELDEANIRRPKEVAARFDALTLTVDRHMSALALNCDETMRRKLREVDDVLAQMRRDMLERVSAAIAHSPPPEPKRLRAVASQVNPARGATDPKAADALTPIARRVQALSELVAMSTDASSSADASTTSVANVHHHHNNSSNHHHNASGSSAALQQQFARGGGHGHGSAAPLFVPAAPAMTSTLHHTPRLYQPAPLAGGPDLDVAPHGGRGTGVALGGVSYAAPLQPLGPQHYFHGNQPPQVRYDMSPGLNASGPAVTSAVPGATPYEGELHTFLW